MRKPRLWKPGSFRILKPGDPGYVSKTATRFRVLRGAAGGAIISNAEKIKRTKGAHPKKLAAGRAAGVYPYKSAVSEAQAAKQIKTRSRLSRVGTWLHPEQVHGTHIFLSKDGTEQRRELNGRPLAIMQTYREDVHGRFDKGGKQVIAGGLQTGDGSALKKYDRMVIRDVNGNHIRPETNIKKLRRWWDSKTVRQRNRFEEELFQSGEGETRMAA
jgi:hypothetical protein